MKPLSERDENSSCGLFPSALPSAVGMKPLSERDENRGYVSHHGVQVSTVGMKPLSERDENLEPNYYFLLAFFVSRNEATL